MIQDGKTGWVVEPGDTQGLLQAAQAFIGQSEQQRQQMSAAARAFAQATYAFDAVVDQYRKLYDSL